MDNTLMSLLEISLKNPSGFTVKLDTLEYVTSGYSIAYQETQDSFGAEGLARVIEHARRHGGYVGGWKCGDKYYFDSVMIVTDRDEAIRKGVENKQLAIYNLDDGVEIEL